MPDPAPDPVPDQVPVGPPGQRAAAWSALAARYAAAGRRDRALVAARTAFALVQRVDPGEHAVGVARDAVAALTGPDVVPLHVDMAGGAVDGGPGGPAAGAEQRAVWVGAPADPVLAMLGWVERGNGLHVELEVVRVVVPGTRRGRGAFTLLVDALPDAVPVEVVLPARDPKLLRLVEKAGFAAVEGSLSARGHVGGSLRARRPAGGAT